MPVGAEGPAARPPISWAGLRAIVASVGQDDAQDLTALTPGQVRLRLFLTSFLILFFELICIRWIPAYVRLLGYFLNFILLAAFLGSGLGILAGRRPRLWLPPFPWMLLILVLTVVSNKFQFNINSTTVLFYGAAKESAARSEHYVVLPVLLTLVALAFVPLARPLGRLLKALPPLQAYTVDILGSLAGTAAFFVMSYLSLSPVVWFSVLAVLVLLTLPRRQIVLGVPCLIATLWIVLQLVSPDILWSPYYKIGLSHNGSHTFVNVNNVGHQDAAPYLEKEDFYFRAYDLLGQRPFGRVLVLGAGTGSDVSIALHHGAARVDAVEIDPTIHRIGRQFHPDKPYADPRVTVHINDGRAFLRNAREQYDLIVFALPDSLTLTSGYSSLRLESFLLTADALRQARAHLSDDGLLVVYNYYREDWLVRKLAGMVESAFGEPPFVTTYGAWGKAAAFMAGPRLRELDPYHNITYREPAPPEPPSRGIPLPIVGFGRMAGEPGRALATDDWPFVYMPKPTVPLMYVGSLALLAVIGVALLLLIAPRAVLRRFDWHFFFLGSAFMLLETRSLVTFALLFGTTWMVNSLVFFAILFSVLLAIRFNARFRVQHVGPLYVLLFALLLINLVVPLGTLLGITSPALRYLLASTLTFAPIFVANVVFSRSFRDTEEADIAFASNLLGIMLGGMFEYLALATGYQSLLWLVIGFYALALWCWRRHAA